MTEEERIIASYFAHLASIKSLDQLSEGERLVLVEQWQRVLPAFLDENAVSRVRASGDQLMDALREVQFRVQTDIGGLLEGAVITWTAPQHLFLHPQHHVVYEMMTVSVALDGEVRVTTEVILPAALRALHTLIMRRPFPFKRCPICAKVFVPVKKQRYCSPNCTYQGVEGNRREERKAYMKVWHQKEKKKKKAAAKKQRRAKKDNSK